MRNAILVLLLIAAVAAGAWANPLEGLSQLKEGRTMRDSSCDPNWQNGNGDARPILPGATLTLAEMEGPGVINHFWNTIAATDRGYSALLVLRMYWDGEEQPSVECPIGDFFGVGHGVDAAYVSLPVKVSSEGRGRNCYWPMPFRKSAKITVTNEGRGNINAFYYYLDWAKVPALPENEAYFHAMYRQEHPAIMGQNYLIADIVGRGHFVGTVLSVRQHAASWWGEGDDFFFIDGEKEPSLRGTGTEDYFCDGWGFRDQTGPYYGVSLYEMNDPGSRCTVYRWHIADPVLFEKSLRLEIEHKGVSLNEDGSFKDGFTERDDDFSSVGFWYQTEPHKAYPEMPKGFDRLYLDYGQVQESEAVLGEAKATDGALSKQDGGWSGGAQLFWTPAQADQSLTIPFEIKEAGKRSVILLLTSSWDYGTFEFLIDGKPCPNRRVDAFSKSIVTKEYTLDTRDFEAGRHEVTIRNVGKAADSKGYFVGVDGIIVGK
jgi:hypothetical protein